MAHPLAVPLAQGAQSLGLSLSPAQHAQLLDYLDLIAKWNKVYNLTSVRDPQEMLTHHLLDSLAVVAPLRQHLQKKHPSAHHTPGDTPGNMPEKHAPKYHTPKDHIPENLTPGRLLDVGSGAGLPGVVLAIVCPELDVTCVDTVAKKAAFIQQVAVTLNLPNLRGVHARVEELKVAPFDVVTSRAFSSLVDFVSLTRFHVKQPHGVWMAMKGKHPADELVALPKDVVVFHVEPLDVPGLGAERCLVWMRPGA
jgi:16S rRNA (guanine527-N7)-methyltransferase